MNEGRYVRLSGLDHAFLHFESDAAYMHVALTAVFDAGSLAGADGGVDIARIRAHLAGRLHLLPRYRQRLHYVPLTNDPVWVDDDDFELDFHVRHSHLPRPGSDAQLKTLAARILERPLDRKRPLWEMWFIEGLPGGRFAMLCKVHHCMVDGIAGIDLLAALLSPVPETAIERPRPWTPAPPPTAARLLRDELRRRGDASLRALRSLPALVGGDVGAVGARLGSLWGFVRAGVRGAAATPFNGPIGPHRRVEWLGFDIAEMKLVKQRLGGTLNDVVLATVTGALRRYLAHHGAGVAEGELRALIPVSTRPPAERGETGNRVSAWIAPLPVDEVRPLERFRRIHATTEGYRSGHEERGAEVLTETAEWTTALPLAVAVRLIARTRAFNVIVTNVPGPPVPFHLLDATMLAGYPHVPLFDNQGLGIALLSYAGKLYFGLVGEWDLLPDLDRLAGWVEASYAELREAAGVSPTPACGERKLRRVPAHAVG
ncbi:MAG: wax ester/triacylglycerol synthase family O-acyltransferase [Thermodesulfobacteriota bacterium]